MCIYTTRNPQSNPAPVVVFPSGLHVGNCGGVGRHAGFCRTSLLWSIPAVWTRVLQRKWRDCNVMQSYTWIKSSLTKTGLNMFDGTFFLVYGTFPLFWLYFTWNVFPRGTHVLNDFSVPSFLKDFMPFACRTANTWTTWPRSRPWQILQYWFKIWRAPYPELNTALSSLLEVPMEGCSLPGSGWNTPI